MNRRVLPLPQWRLLNHAYRLHVAGGRRFGHVLTDAAGADVSDVAEMCNADYLELTGAPNSGLTAEDVRRGYLRITAKGTAWVCASPHNAVLYAVAGFSTTRAVPLRKVIDAAGIDDPAVFHDLGGTGLLAATTGTSGEPTDLAAAHARHPLGVRVWLTSKGRQVAV